jgi:hypothetical protein
MTRHKDYDKTTTSLCETRPPLRKISCNTLVPNTTVPRKLVRQGPGFAGAGKAGWVLSQLNAFVGKIESSFLSPFVQVQNMPAAEQGYRHGIGKNGWVRHLVRNPETANEQPREGNG